MKIHLVTPAPPCSLAGNRRTAERIAAILRALGHHVRIACDWNGEAADFLIALHARKSAASASNAREWLRTPHST